MSVSKFTFASAGGGAVATDAQTDALAALIARMDDSSDDDDDDDEEEEVTHLMAGIDQKDSVPVKELDRLGLSPMKCFYSPPPSDAPTVEFRGCKLDSWHVSKWEGPALMLIVAPKAVDVDGQGDDLTADFIRHTENYLDTQPSGPKFVAHDASKLRIQSIAALCANYAECDVDCKGGSSTPKEDGWNVILRYHRLSDVPPYLVSAARYVVLHSLLLPTTAGPSRMIDNQLEIKAPLLPLATKPFSAQWFLEKETGRWIKAQTEETIPTIQSHWGYDTYTHSIPFIIVDRRTHSLFADVL
jgi:hypothetical protein